VATAHKSRKNRATPSSRTQTPKPRSHKGRAANLAAIPVEVETGSQSTRGQAVGTAEIPVALKTRPDSADAVATAEIPVAVNNTGTQRAGRKGKSRRAGSKETVIPMALSARTGSAQSRAERRRQTHRSKSRKPEPHKAQATKANHAIEPADPFTRAAITATGLEEDLANTVAQVSLAAIDTFEGMSGFLLRMPKLARGTTRGKLLTWKAPDVRRSAERARESIAAVLPFAA
jgi:hypothetical protein